VIVCALVGWCPDPKPKPKPTPLPGGIVAGLVGGIAGGYLVYFALALEGSPTGTEFVSILIGAFAVGRVLQEIVGWIGREKTA
jgi:hypothetical protein